MNEHAVNWAVEQTLPQARKFVLVIVACHAGQNGRAWPSVDRLADMCSMSKRSVQRHLAELEFDGLLSREPRGRHDGSQTSNQIGLVLPPVSPREEPLTTTAETTTTTTTAEENGVVLTDNTVKEKNKYPTPREITRAVNAVWAHYCNVMHPRSNVADSEQRKLIRDALRIATKSGSSSGFEVQVAELCRAIDGCAASPFHMGANDRDKKYNRISNILKGKRGGRTTREQIDMFLEIAEKAGSQSDVPAASAGRVQQARRYVLDGWEYPNDAVVVERAEEAKAWLVEQGWQIDYEPRTNRPLFTR